jgi:hypothetical protein
MNLIMALLRSAYLAFLIGYTLAVSPLALLWSGATTRQGTTVTIPVLERVFTAAWLAIGWVALEVVLAWARVALDARARRRPAPPATGPQPAP